MILAAGNYNKPLCYIEAQASSNRELTNITTLMRDFLFSRLDLAQKKMISHAEPIIVLSLTEIQSLYY